MLGHNEAISTASISEIDVTMIVLTRPLCLDVDAACWMNVRMDAACWLDLETDSVVYLPLWIDAEL